MKKLRICYFLPETSSHSIRFLNYFFNRGHEIYVFSNPKFKFYRWYPNTFTQQQDIKNNKFKKKRKINDNKSLFKILNFIHSAGRKTATKLPTIFYNISFRTYHLFRSRVIRHQIKLIDPAVLHALYISSFVVDTLYGNFQPYVLTVWGSDIRELKELNQYRIKLLHTSLKKADAVTAPTDDLLNLCAQNGASKDKGAKIGMPGIDISNFTDINVGNILDKLDIPSNCQIIFSPRAMSSLYRINNIVEAFNILQTKESNVFLLLLDYHTDKNYLREIEKQIDDLGLRDKIRIFYDMPIPYSDMNKLYAISSMVVSIPKTDGLPQTILESLASSSPVICGDLKTYDGIIDHKESGIRVSGDDIDELASAMIELLNNNELKEKIIKKGRQIVEEHGDILTEMRKMEDLYYSLVETKMQSI